MSEECVDIKVSAPGKVIITGEHSVVYGKSALAACINRRTYVHLQEKKTPENRSPQLIVNLPCIKVSETFNFNDIIKNFFETDLPLTKSKQEFNWQKAKYINQPALLESISKFFQCKYGEGSFSTSQQNSLLAFFFIYIGMFYSVDVRLTPIEVNVTTELTLSSGTGSSASYCVTVAAAFFQYIRVKTYNKVGLERGISKDGFKPTKIFPFDIKTFSVRERKIISTWAWYAEKIMHGNPSGIDNSVCTYGMIIQFRLGKFVNPIDVGEEMRLLLVDTKVPRDTKQLVEKVSVFKEKQPEKFNETLLAMDGLAMKAEEHITEINAITGSKTKSTVAEQVLQTEYDKLSQLISLNHSLLSELGVSHPSLDEICYIAANHGLSGKLTGAGGGGYAIILITPSVQPEQEKVLVDDLEEAGFSVLPIKIGGPGVTID